MLGHVQMPLGLMQSLIVGTGETAVSAFSTNRGECHFLWMLAADSNSGHW